MSKKSRAASETASAEPSQWGNRIVGSGEVDPKDLLANPKNWAIHPTGQQDALLAVLKQVGWVGRVMVNQRTGFVVDGHARVALALREQQPAVPVDYVDLTEGEEDLILATFDMITRGRVTDVNKLSELLAGIQIDDPGLQDFIVDFKKLEGLRHQEQLPEDPGPDLDRADELMTKWETSIGQLWQLGAHRIICGDCTDSVVVGRLMAGEKAKLLMADPPYNVKYTGGSSNENERIDSYKDNLPDDEYLTWLRSALSVGYMFTDTKAPLLLWFASAKIRLIMDAFEGAGWQARTMIVWNKLNAHYGALGAQYKHRYEPLWYCFKPKRTPRFYGPNNETTVWDFDQPHINNLHPTMKPVELYERCLRNHTRKADLVLELFSGSGTTIIACERLERCGFALEIEPKYVAVTIERWHRLTGEKPKLLD